MSLTDLFLCAVNISGADDVVFFMIYNYNRIISICVFIDNDTKLGTVETN